MASFQFLFISFCFFLGGSHSVKLRDYSWLCTHNSLVVLREPEEMWGIETRLAACEANQMSYSLYYCSSPISVHFKANFKSLMLQYWMLAHYNKNMIIVLKCYISIFLYILFLLPSFLFYSTLKNSRKYFLAFSLWLIILIKAYLHQSPM